MRRIIGGKAYDTDSAERVASGSHDHELSDARWSLYRTSAGAWFEVVAGHNGVVEEFQPLTDGEARRWLERNANRLVERYFGEAPEASAADHKGLRFSRRTFVAAIGVLECLTQATLTRFLYELGPDFPGLAGDEFISKSKRLSKLIGVYDQRPERTVEGDDTLQDVIIEKAAALVRVRSPVLGGRRTGVGLRSQGILSPLGDGWIRRHRRKPSPLSSRRRESSRIGLRDRALIGLMVYSFSRIGAAIGMPPVSCRGSTRPFWLKRFEGSWSRRTLTTNPWKFAPLLPPKVRPGVDV